MSAESEGLVFRCPACGGPNAAAARQCTFCSVPLATRRCTHCFALSASVARHCSACGRELGLEPLGDTSAFSCPACSASLTAYPEAAGSLFDCARCGGHFVEHALLRSLVEQRAALALGARPKPPEKPPAGKVSYRPCAQCRALMQRKNFGDASGVIVDVCAQHGIWFDEGELPKVLDFVENGGLERAKLRIEEARRAAATERRIANQTPTFTPADTTSADWKTGGIIDFIVSILL